MKIRPDRLLVWIGVLALAAAVMVSATVSFILPAYLESSLIPRLAARMGLEPGQVHVRHIGWWGADLGPFELQRHGVPVVILAAVQIDYTPLSLLRRRIQGITLAGLDLELEVTPEGVFIPGFKPAATPSPAMDAVLPNLETLLPFDLHRLAVTQSRVVLNQNGRRYTIPVDIRLQTGRLSRGELQGRVRLSVMDNPVLLAAVVDQRANSARVTVESEGFGLGCLARSARLPEGFDAAGSMRIEGRGTLRLNPAALTSLDLSASLTDTRIRMGGGGLSNMVVPQGGLQPITLSLNGDDGGFQVVCGPFRLSGPVAAEVTTLKGNVRKDGSAWSLDAQIDTVLPAQSLADGLSLEKALPMGWALQVAQTAGGHIHFKLSSAGSHSLAARTASLTFSQQNEEIEVEGQYGEDGLEVQGRLSSGGLRLSLPGGQATAAGAQIGATFIVPPEGVQTPPRLDVRAGLTGVQTRLGDALITLPKITLNARSRNFGTGTPEIEGRLKIAEGQVQDRPHRLDMTGLNAELPLRWPPVDHVSTGRLELRAVQWSGRSLGGVKGMVRQSGRMLAMDLEHQSKLLAGLIVSIKGRLGGTDMHADVQVPAYQPAGPLDLGRFLPAAAGFRADGRIQARAEVDMVDGSPLASAEFKIAQGRLTRDEDELEVDGIEMDLRFNDLAAFKSAPRQKLRVENLKLGKLAAHKLDVDFQLEDRQTLFVEKMGLQWCGGRINTAALRLVTGKEDYDVTLFCDRLKLAGVLEQLGAAEASGEGTVNGRIPVRWTRGRLSFDNGFLYSTPGQPGIIKLTGTEVLLSGMPPGSPQRTQLDIATEALKDYTYQWAKLSVQSEKDTLLLKLQLDGKPNRLLPFAYDQALGQFTRIKGQGQAEFKGISIDLNFKSPLNEIVHYKEFLNRN